jgi:hypothetical protein
MLQRCQHLVWVIVRTARRCDGMDAAVMPPERPNANALVHLVLVGW